MRTITTAGNRLIRRVVLATLALMAAYAVYEYVRIHRTLQAADLPSIPLDARLRYPGAGASRAPYTVVVVGDSTAQGTGASSVEQSFGAVVARSLAESGGRDVELLNLGVSGATARDVPSKQIPRLRGLSPDLILLSVGANDVTGWTSTEEYLAQMEEIIRQLRATGADVAVLDVPAIVTAPLLPLPARLVFDVRTRRFNAGLQALRDRHAFLLVPIYERTREPFERDRANFAADGYHPSSKGYALWAEATLATLQGLAE